MAPGPRNDGRDAAVGGPRGDGPRARRFWPIPLLTLFLALPLTAWLGGYFWVNSTPGRTLVADWLLGRAPAGSLVVGAVHWGPLPDELQLADVSILGEDGRPLIHATEIAADVVVSHLLDGDLVVDRVRARGYLLELAWGEDGELNVSRALKRPETKPGSDEPRPPKRRRVLDLRRIELLDGDVTLSWPRWGLQFSAVSARGALTIDRGGELAIHADLTGGRAHAMWGERGQKTVKVSSVDIIGFDWAEQGFDVRRLALTAEDGSAVDVDGSLEFSGDLELAVEGDIALGATTAALTAGQALPAGGRVRALELELAGTTLAGRAERVELPVLEIGPLSATSVVTTLDDFTFVPGLLKPSGALAMHDAKVERLSAPGIEAIDTSIGRVAVSVRAKSSATLDDVVARELTIEDRVTTHARGQVDASFGLTSGEFDANVVTDMGRVGASGTVRISPFSKKLTVSLRVALEQVGGDLASYLLGYLPPDPAASLSPPLEGFAVFRTVLGKQKVEGKKGKHWVATTNLDEAQLSGGGRVIFDGEAWAAKAPSEAPATP